MVSQVIPTHGNTLKSACLTKSSAAETVITEGACRDKYQPILSCSYILVRVNVFHIKPQCLGTVTF